jgi:hypothetical protein
LHGLVADRKLTHILLASKDLNLCGLPLRQARSGAAGNLDTPVSGADTNKSDSGAV